MWFITNYHMWFVNQLSHVIVNQLPHVVCKPTTTCGLETNYHVWFAIPLLHVVSKATTACGLKAATVGLEMTSQRSICFDTPTPSRPFCFLSIKGWRHKKNHLLSGPPPLAPLADQKIKSRFLFSFFYIYTNRTGML